TVIKDTVVKKDTVYGLTTGLVAYFNFNGGSLHDSSGLQNDIYSNTATPTADRFGRANNAYLFNGTSSVMRIHNNSSLNPGSITLMAIAKLNGFYTGDCHASALIMKGPLDQGAGVYGLRVQYYGATCTSPLDTTREQISGFIGDYPNDM